MPELRNQRTFRYVPLNSDDTATNFYQTDADLDDDRGGGTGRICNGSILLTTENNDRKIMIDGNFKTVKNDNTRKESTVTINSHNSNNSNFHLDNCHSDITPSNINNITLNDHRKQFNLIDGTNGVNDLYSNGDELNMVFGPGSVTSSSSSSLSLTGFTSNSGNKKHMKTGTITIIKPMKQNVLNILSNCLQCSHLMKMALISLAMILLYLTLSICLIFYQKSLVKVIRLPFAIVTYHLCVKLLMATIIRFLNNHHKTKKAKNIIDNNNCYNSNTINNNNNSKLTHRIDWKIAVRKLAPTGIFSGIDIGFSNWSLELVSISLYTMTKSSSIVFILLFAILLGLEKKSLSLILIVSLIATGLFMFTYKSTQFDTMGFVFILLASVCGGIRWTLAQLVMQKSKLGLHNPIDMIYYMQPWMIFSILPFLIIFEGNQLSSILHSVINNAADKPEYYLLNICKITFAAFLAFFMEVSEFLVLARTSSLTLSIACIFKDIFQLVLAVEFDGDQLSTVNVLGLIVCLIGTCCHLIHKYLSMKKLEEIKSFNIGDDGNGNEDDDDNYPDDGVSSESPTMQQRSSKILKNNNHNLFNYNNKYCTTSLTMASSSTPTMAISSASSIPNSKQKTKTSLTMPLLKSTNISDFDDDSSDDTPNNRDPHHLNSSDIVFDILKHRDVTR